jgi:hypothetical protein
MGIFQPKSAVSTTRTVSGTFPDTEMYAAIVRQENII